jgi:hypothetical protein
MPSVVRDSELNGEATVGANRKENEASQGRRIVEGKRKMVTLTVTPDRLRGESSSSVNRKEVELSAEVMELARGIEPPTCGLQNRNTGVAQVFDDMGNPLVIIGE